MAYQRAMWPCPTVNITQGYGILSKTHKKGYPLDNGGVYNLFAPFDCKVTEVYVKKGHSYEVWLTSTKKVLCSNGVYDYLTLSITHPKGIDKLKVGQTFKQFQSLGLNTSMANMTGNVDGPHAHIELSLGKKAGWDPTLAKKDIYVNVNAVPPQDYLFIKEDTKVINEVYKKVLKYHFYKESELTYRVVGVPSEPLYIRDKKTDKVIGKLYNGDEVIKFDNKTRCLVYHYEALGLTYKKYLKK